MSIVGQTCHRVIRPSRGEANSASSPVGQKQKERGFLNPLSISPEVLETQQLELEQGNSGILFKCRVYWSSEFIADEQTKNLPDYSD